MLHNQDNLSNNMSNDDEDLDYSDDQCVDNDDDLSYESSTNTAKSLFSSIIEI